MRADPQALQRCLLQSGGDALPLDPKCVYGRRAPLCVEIGFGSGEALAWLAGRHPERDYLGFELPPESIVRACRALEHSGVSNVRVVRGDARYLLGLLLPPRSVSRALMQFPMPWPKERHAKHRVASPQFADALARVLAPGGRFELVTDQDWYAQDAARAFREHPAFAEPTAESDPNRPFRTRYERKWLEEGRMIYRVVAPLAADPPDPPAAQPVPVTMENLRLENPPADAAVRALDGYTSRDGDLLVEVKRTWRGEAGWLLQVLAADGAFSQLFHLQLRLREDGATLLEVGLCPRPYWTAGVRHAVRAVGARLRGIPA